MSGSSNFFVVCQSKVAYAKSSTLVDTSLAPMTAVSLLPITVLGYGASGVLHKSWCLHHIAKLVGGSLPGFDQVRREVRTFSSDQGDEHEILNTRVLEAWLAALTSSLACVLRCGGSGCGSPPEARSSRHGQLVEGAGWQRPSGLAASVTIIIFATIQSSETSVAASPLVVWHSGVAAVDLAKRPRR